MKALLWLITSSGPNRGAVLPILDRLGEVHPGIFCGLGALLLLALVAWVLTAKNVPRWIARMRDPGYGGEMSFFEHLDELRSVILACLGALLILTIGAWFVTAPVMDFLIQNVARLEKVVFIKPMEAFTSRLLVALLTAFIVGLPFIAFQVWSFVVPGLLQREKRIVLPLVFWSTLLFLLGVAFATFGLSPTMLTILRSFSTELIQESLAIRYLLDFFIKMAFACGILFQLPLVVAVLSFFGLVTPDFLKSKWRHAVVLILIIAAVVTPGDGPSQLVLAVPIILLYFISIYISMAIHRAKRDSEETSDEDAGDGTDPGPDAGDPEMPREEGTEVTGGDAGEEEDEGVSRRGPQGPGPGSPPADEAPTDTSGPDQERSESDRENGRPREEGEPRSLHPPDDWSI
jgi:sec-independent protein translocase protein TatC